MVDSLLEILTEGRSQTFYKPIDVHLVTNAIDEHDFSWWNIHSIRKGTFCRWNE